MNNSDNHVLRSATSVCLIPFREEASSDAPCVPGELAVPTMYIPYRGNAVSAQQCCVSPMSWKWPFLCCFLCIVAMEAEAENFQFSVKVSPLSF